MQAELIFKGGPIHATARSQVAALAVLGDKIIAAGTEADVLNVAGPSTRTIDLAGRAILPGLCDSHLHVLNYGQTLRWVRLADASSLEDAMARVGQRAAGQPAGTWIIGRGFLEDKWPVIQTPTRQDLDRVAPNHPVLITRGCGHISVANSLALRLAGVGAGTPDPQGGLIDRDGRGEATGILREKAAALVRDQVPQPTRAELREALAAGVRDAAAHGITDLHSDDVRTVRSAAGTWELWNEVAGPEAFPMRAYLLFHVDWYDEFRQMKLKRGDGNGWVRAGMVKIFVDGSMGGHTAALREPYADLPSSRGIYIYPEDEFFGLVERIHRDGNQIGCHAIGDGAVSLLLDGIERANSRYPRADHRHRAIHACSCPPDLMQQMKRLGVIGDIQPKFMHTDGYFYRERLGRERGRWYCAWKSMLDMGIPCCGGSDCPVEPLAMPLQLHAAVARTDLNGHGADWEPQERLTVAEAVGLHTEGAAYAAFAERVKGRLLPGMLADLVMYDQDPFAVSPAELQHLKVQLTMVGGRVAYEA